MMNGSDMPIDNSPFQIMGLERLVEWRPQYYIGKDALERVGRDGVKDKLVGIEFEGHALEMDPADFWLVLHDAEKVGRVTDPVWSQRLKRNIGYVWVPFRLTERGTKLDVESQHTDGSSGGPP